MKLIFMIITIAGFLTAVRAGSLKRCFAAVFCTSRVNAANTSGSPEWFQVVPTIFKNNPELTGGKSKDNWISNQGYKSLDRVDNLCKKIKSSISNDVGEVQKRIQKYDGEVRSLEQQIDNLDVQNKKMSNRVTKMQAKLDELTANYTELVKAIQQEEVDNNSNRRINNNKTKTENNTKESIRVTVNNTELVKAIQQEEVNNTNKMKIENDTNESIVITANNTELVKVIQQEEMNNNSSEMKTENDTKESIRITANNTELVKAIQQEEMNNCSKVIIANNTKESICTNNTEQVKAIQQEMNNSSDKMKIEITTIKSIPKNCPIIYNDKCFLPIMSKKMTRSEAQRFCAGEGGKLADIYDKTHFNMIMKIIRDKYMNGRNRVYLWLGMTYNPQTGDLFMSDGTEAKYKRWWPGEPIRRPRVISLAVNKIPTHDRQYLKTFGGANASGNPLCEI